MVGSRIAKLLGVKCIYAISGIMSIFKKRPRNEKDCGDELVKSPVSKEALAQIARQRPTVKKYMKEEDEDNEEAEKERPLNEKDCGDELVKSPVSKEALAQVRSQRRTIQRVEEDESHS
jgi:hypothetical protein